MYLYRDRLNKPKFFISACVFFRWYTEQQYNNCVFIWFHKAWQQFPVESFALFSTDNCFDISVSNSLLLQNLPLFLLRSIVYLQYPVKRVSLCSLQITALKLVCKFRYCCKICRCLLDPKSYFTPKRKYRKLCSLFFLRHHRRVSDWINSDQGYLVIPNLLIKIDYTKNRHSKSTNTIRIFSDHQDHQTKFLALIT